MTKVGIVALVVAGLLVPGALAESVMHTSGTAHFVSDLEPPQTVDVPSFDGHGGLWVLDNVLIQCMHSGSVDISADNDDEFQSAAANARMIRIFGVTGPDNPTFTVTGSKEIASDPVTLAADDGDGDAWDPTPPDGHLFDTLTYAPELGATWFVTNLAAYYNPPATIDFEITPDTMVNDVQWDPTPAMYQLEVEHAVLDVYLEVTYTYHIIPEPATFSLLALGALALVRRR
ncbi:MAG: PEP-CTERM sorting domain-containing protein [Phycisphaerae bacterium]|nr:PEP-CTERM sorting domain-containing protein [Phycisphaerae bacterium]